MCCMIAADHHPLAVGQRVHVDLEGVFQEAVDQHRLARRGGSMASSTKPLQLRFVVDDRHRAPAQHERRPHQHRIADPRGDCARFLERTGDAVLRLRDVQLVEQLGEPLAVLGQVRWRRGDVPKIGTPAASSAAARLSGVCPPNCTITPIGCSRSTTFSTCSSVSGSKYSRSAVS